MNISEFMDETEIFLIQKFFNLDITLYEINDRNIIGVSNFYNIIDFYRFEPKPLELKFWKDIDLILNNLKLKDINIYLEINKINLSYQWYDFVTKIDFTCKFINNILYLPFDCKFEEINIYNQILNIICIRQFLTDICKDHLYNISLEEKKLEKKIEYLKQASIK